MPMHQALVSVTNPSGTFAIDHLSRTSSLVGEQVTIYGFGFGATRGTSTVTFVSTNLLESVTLSSYVSWSATEITVVVPSLSIGNYNIYVTVYGVNSNQTPFTVNTASQIRYVSTSGNNANTGTSTASAWRTIQYAADTINGGMQVVVAAGTYAERPVIGLNKNVNGTASTHTRFVTTAGAIVTLGFDVRSSYCDIEGFEVTPGSTTIDGAASVQSRGQVAVKANYVTVKSCNIHDTTHSAVCIYGTYGYMTVENCTITKPAWSGVSMENLTQTNPPFPANCTVRSCTITKFGGNAGIYVLGNNWTIEDCTITGPAVGDFQQPSTNDGDGIDINRSNGSIIRRCRIYDIWSIRGYNSGEHADCIQFWDGVTNLLVDSCVLGSWRPGGADSTPGATNAIMAGTCTSACDITVQNSILLCGIATGTLQSHAHLGSGAANSGVTATIRLYNNTFYGNYPAYNGSNCTVTAYNNVFYSHRLGWYADTSDYNAFMWNQWTDASVSSGALQASTVNASESTSHSLGKTYATRLLAANIFQNPDVTSTTNYGLSASFKPMTTGGLVGAGDPAHAPSTDILGATRSTTAPSIGAYEAGVSTGPFISSLSAPNTPVGAQITITGSGFGATQGTSLVVFGERINSQGWAPCAQAATVTSWSNTSITVAVPAMSPGKTGEPNSYHPVYVVTGVTGTWPQTQRGSISTASMGTGGPALTAYTMSNSYDFFITPAITITTGTSSLSAVTSTSGTWVPSTATFTTGAESGFWLNTVNDVLFDGVTFTSTSQTLDASNTGCITIGEGHQSHRITFLNCTITGNQGAGAAGRRGVSAVKVWSNIWASSGEYAPCTNLSFIGCNIGTPASGGFSEMGIEVVSQWADGLGNGDTGVGESISDAIIDCTFEPCGGEPISWGSPGDHFAIVRDCLIKGGGYNKAVIGFQTEWPYVFECNASHYVEFRDSEMWNWNGGAFNFNAYSTRGTAVANINPHLLVKNVICDYSHLYQETQAVIQSMGGNYWGQLFIIGARSYVDFIGCAFNTGTSTVHCWDAGLADDNNGWGAPAWETQHHINMGTSTITGYIGFLSRQPAASEPGITYWSTTSGSLDKTVFDQVTNSFPDVI